MRSLSLALACAFFVGALAGCSTPADDGDPEDAVAVDEGKEDNFLSQDALEYTLTGKASVTLDASYATKTDAERMAAAKKLHGYQQLAHAWIVPQYFVDNEEEDAIFLFGGGGGMAICGLWEDFGVS